MPMPDSPRSAKSSSAHDLELRRGQVETSSRNPSLFTRRMLSKSISH